MRRILDSACYLKEKSRIIVFGSKDGPLTIEIDISKENSIEIAKSSLKLPFEYH